MGFQLVTLKLPTNYTPAHLQERIAKQLNSKIFRFQIENKSLDARKKNDIHWVVRVGVSSPVIRGNPPEIVPTLQIPYHHREKKVLVVGSGPAGFFAAYVLQKAGFDTTLIERGKDVAKREEAIHEFETAGLFDPTGNYAFGEGGAGTFSDGKLTARTKTISQEKQFILTEYINAGAPEEIAYLSYPHLGSDNLKTMIKKLRIRFQELGGEIQFETLLTDVKITDNRVVGIQTTTGEQTPDIVVIATGHSAVDTSRMLMASGVMFRTKPFALGARVEHPQGLINRAQWGVDELPGLHAAEYRLTSHEPGCLPIYTFCMCPGGVIVPSAAFAQRSVVNGMSQYQRNSHWANAACVVAVTWEQLLEKTVTPGEALDWLDQLEQTFYNVTSGYQIPACSVSEFINEIVPSRLGKTSYPFGLLPHPLWTLFPAVVSQSLKVGLQEFSCKMNGFDKGLIMGLESKTSSPIQVVREPDMRCTGIDNLYVVGEGSGFSGGIISSGADGIRAAMNIIR